MISREAEAAILALRDAEGRISPSEVVESARDPKHPLHDFFEWDDGAAADSFRVQQARGLIRRVRVHRVEERRSISLSTMRVSDPPRFVRDPLASPKSQGYRDVLALREDPHGAHAAIVSAFQNAASALRRARAVADVLGMQEDVEGLVDQVVALQERAEGARPTVAQ